MKFHEYANLFPMMPESDLMRLAEDIKEKGQSDPIITLDGMILDGRNRYKACEINGITPRCEEYSGDDPLGFVVSHNLHRRHMNESQRGMVGAKLAQLTVGSNQHSAIALPSQKQAAEMLNVGVDSIKRSKQVLKDGIKELEDMQTSGEISASAAAAVSRLPEEEQRKAVSGGVAGVKDAAKALASQKCKKTHSECLNGSDSSKSQSENTTEEKPKRLPKYIPNDAEELWIQAKSRLDNILPSDISREKILNEIIAYCQARITSNK